MLIPSGPQKNEPLKSIKELNERPRISPRTVDQFLGGFNIFMSYMFGLFVLCLTPKICHLTPKLFLLLTISYQSN